MEESESRHQVKVRRIKLGCQGLEVSIQGLGCSGMSRPPKPGNEMIELIHHAIQSGVTFLDTSDVYGPFFNEILLGKMGELKKLVEEGKIKYVGLSEVCASTIRRAHAVHPLSAVQLEWSLWSRDIEEEIVPTCRELGIGIVAYSPLGRGFFSLGPKVVENFTENDYRRTLPRFQPENLVHNKHIYERACEMAVRKGCTSSQLALAWVHHRGIDVCPIPGTSKLNNLNQNIEALSMKLTPDEMAELESYASADKVKGGRGKTFLWENSETPPLSSW